MHLKIDTYRGPLKLAILDLAGTVLDFGSRAPAATFVEIFERNGIQISDAEARSPMGMHKRDHIAVLCRNPSVEKQWEQIHGRPVSETDVDTLYEAFIPLQLEALPRYAALVPGAGEALHTLRMSGMRIALTTGYSREMMNLVLSEAAKQGLVADAAVCGSDVPAGRPAPWMAFECARLTAVYPPASCIKCGDTLVDIEEGRNAGMWSVGVAVTGNMTALSLEEWNALDAGKQEAYRQKARSAMFSAGAHAVLDSVAELPDLVDEINLQMLKGGAPDIIS